MTNFTSFFTAIEKFFFVFNIFKSSLLFKKDFNLGTTVISKFRCSHKLTTTYVMIYDEMLISIMKTVVVLKKKKNPILAFASLDETGPKFSGNTLNSINCLNKEQSIPR